MTDTLNLYYARIANMGDLLNPLIIERCFGYRVERCSFLTGDLCAIGSGLAQYKLHGNPLMKLQQCINGFTHPHVDVWGSGFINYDHALDTAAFSQANCWTRCRKNGMISVSCRTSAT